MNAEVVADGILLAIGRLSLIICVGSVIVLAVRVAYWIWSDSRQARKVKRAAKRAQRPAKPFSLPDFMGMRGE